MTDIYSKEKRSWIMARIKASGNRSTELRLVQLLREEHIAGWRRGAVLFGKPDFVFPAHRVAIFVDGEFWHGHPKLCRLPRTNRRFWREKILKNCGRDRAVTRHLRCAGWKVLRVWQHSLGKNPRLVAERIRRALAESLLRKTKESEGLP